MPRVESGSVVFLFLASLAGLFPGASLPVAVGWKSVAAFDIFFAAAVVSAAKGNRFVRPDRRLVAASAAFCLSGWATLAFHPSTEGVRSVLRETYSLLVLCLAAHLRTDAALARRMILRPVGIALGIAWVVLGIENGLGTDLGENTSDALPEGIHRLGGFTGGNALILFVCLAAPLAAGSWPATVAMFASAFATLSRSMLGVGLAVWLASRGVGHETRWKRRSITGLSALAIALGLLTYAFTTFHLESGGGHTARLNSAPSAYLTLHRAAVDMFGTSPLVGLGPGSFGSALRDFSPSEDRALIGGRGGSSDFWDPHSAILGLAAEQGLAGLAAFAWLVAEIYRRIGSGRDPGHRRAAIAAITGLLAGGYFVDWFPFKGLWLWIGLLVSASRPERPPRD